MAIKFKLTKAEYDKLDDTLKGEYTLVGDSATLDLEGGPDAKAGDKFAAERDRRRAAEKRANDAEAKITELEDKFGDVNTTLAKADKKVADAEKKLADAAKTHTDYVRAKEVDSVATQLANKLSKTSGALLLPHIKARLDLDATDPAAPKAVVLGKDGKPSTATLDALEKEFRDNKDFAAIITVSQASGGGASLRGGTKINGDAGFAGNNGDGNRGPAPLASMNSRDLAARITERRAAKGLEIATQGDRNGA